MYEECPKVEVSISGSGEVQRLAFLNNLVAVIEYEVHHESSSYVHKLWEWK
jgi:hypothetical protein